MSYSTSPFINPHDAKFIMGAEFESFAPCPCCCFECFVTDGQRARTYANIYENHLQINYPTAPLCCCTPDFCINDNVGVYYFDTPPHTGLCCSCCCGPPVIYVNNPMCFCIDLKPCIGQTVNAAPCNCFGLKICLICGNPCYTLWGLPSFKNCLLCLTGSPCWLVMGGGSPFLFGVKNAEKLLSSYKGAVDRYNRKHEVPNREIVIFEQVSDNVAVFGETKKLRSGVYAEQ